MDQESFNKIASEISSDDSHVGIDAKKTHVMILYKLEQITKRLEHLEQRLAELSSAR